MISSDISILVSLSLSFSLFEKRICDKSHSKLVRQVLTHPGVHVLCTVQSANISQHAKVNECLTPSLGTWIIGKWMLEFVYSASTSNLGSMQFH